MRPGAKPRVSSRLNRRPRQRVIAGAAVLAVAGLGATYLQALRSPSAYASAACSVGAGSEVSAIADLAIVLAAVNQGTCDTITMAQRANLAGVAASTLPEVDLQVLAGPQHLHIDGNDAVMSGTDASGARGLVITLGWDDTLEITDLSIRQMNAVGIPHSKGGALSIIGEVHGADQAQVTLSGMNFSSNDAVAGGDLYLRNVEIGIDQSDSSGGTATQDGGSIYSVDSHVSVTESALEGSRSNSDGGAIYIRNGSLTVDDSLFGQGYAKGNGSAVFADNADVAISTATFWSNEAAQSAYLSPVGAALYVKNAPASIDFSSFVDNQTDYGTTSGIRVASPYDAVSIKAVLIGTSRSLSGGRRSENCSIDSSGTTVSFSLADDASCLFETVDAANSRDSLTTLVSLSDLKQQNVSSCYPWTRSFLPTSSSWAKVNAPTSDLGTGVTEDIWGVPRSGSFTIGSRQWIEAPTFDEPVTDAFPDGVVGTSYPTQTVTATNGPKIDFYSSPLGSGLGFEACTGEFKGTPTTGGSYAVTLTAYGPGGVATSTIQNFVIKQGPAITAGPATTGRIGSAYSSAFTAIGYPTPTFTLSSGTLPLGLRLNTDGTVTGTPTTAGSSTFTVRAWNDVLTESSPPVTRSVTIVIGKVPPTFTRESATSPIPYKEVYSYTYAATGTAPITFAKASGTLPPGLTLDSATGILSGTPTLPGTYTFTIRADGYTSVVTPTQTIVVRPDLPEAPVVTAKAGDGILNLTWPKQTDQGSSPIEKYKVVASPGGKFCEVDATSAASYSCTLSGLRNGTTYTLKAQSYSTVGWGATRSSQGTPCTVPNMPRNITVASKTADGVVKLTWDAPSFDGGTPVLGYVVFWRLRDDVKYVQMPSVTTTSRTITGLVPGKIYRIAVAARNAAGRSDTKTYKIVKVPRS